MSRSCRQKPIFGMVRRRSESDDKRAWHGRLRTQTRTKMAKLADDKFEGAALPEVKDVSNPWSMGKDGKQWLSNKSRSAIASRVAGQKGCNQNEQISLFVRKLRKWMAK